MVVDIIVGVLSFLATGWLRMGITTYGDWIIYAVIVAVIVGVITFALNLLLYKDEFIYLIRKVLKCT